MKTYAIDFETVYSKDVSLTTMGTWHYLRHPECDIYMASVVGPGIEWVGRPEEFDWARIDGHRWVAHNYAFDGVVIGRLRELGVIQSDVQPAEWNCTANLSVYHSGPRNLAGAAKQLLGLSLDKGMRNWMKGRTWGDAVAMNKADALMRYALQDSVACYQLWEKWSPEWPEFEQWLSKHTIEMGWRGVYVNEDLLEEGIRKLKQIKWQAEQGLPWFQGDNPKMSAVLFAKACREAGVEPPASTSEDDPRCAEWEDKYGDRIPWVKHMRNWRKANVVLKKMQTMHKRLRPDGTVPFGLLYGGAHTLRWSGEGGLNLQNNNRDPLLWTGEEFITPKEAKKLGIEPKVKVDVREVITPPPGKKFIISDLSQIEPRVLAWLCKDWEFLKLCASGMSPYEAHARLFMNWAAGYL